MVGNSVQSDVEGARSAGLRAVWVAREQGREPPVCDGTVWAIAELPGLIARLQDA
jgi:FMN phosphatase YigB (HAD superfamily)